MVQGAGPIGLFAIQGAKAIGAAHVTVVEPSARRRDLAVQAGADVVVEPGETASDRILDVTGGLGADLVIECSGVLRSVQVGAEWARRGGVLLLLGYPRRRPR